MGSIYRSHLVFCTCFAFCTLLSVHTYLNIISSYEFLNVQVQPVKTGWAAAHQIDPASEKQPILIMTPNQPLSQQPEPELFLHIGAWCSDPRKPSPQRPCQTSRISILPRVSSHSEPLVQNSSLSWVYQGDLSPDAAPQTRKLQLKRKRPSRSNIATYRSPEMMERWLEEPGGDGPGNFAVVDGDCENGGERGYCQLVYRGPLAFSFSGVL
jgi:hypothetical protein